MDTPTSHHIIPECVCARGRREGSLTHVPDVTLVGEQYCRVGSERVEQDAERFVRCRIDQVVIPVDLVRFQIGHTQIVIARYVARGVRVVENLLEGGGEQEQSRLHHGLFDGAAKREVDSLLIMTACCGCFCFVLLVLFSVERGTESLVGVCY